MKNYIVTMIILMCIIVLSACSGDSKVVQNDTPKENEQPREETQQNEDIPEFTKESAVELMNAFKETITSLFEAETNQMDSYQTKDEIKQYFKNVMSEDMALSMVDSYFTEEDDGVYVIAKDGPTWLKEDQPFELKEVTDKHVKIVQKRENELFGHVMMEYHAIFQDDQWILNEVERVALNKQLNEEGEETNSTNSMEEPETLTNTAQTVLNLIVSKDMKTLATYVHPNRGLLLSPYVNVSEGALIFQQDEVENFFEDVQLYEWGVYDGRGNTIELTPSKYYKEFIYDQDFQDANEILVDEAKQRGNVINNIKDIFPNATVVEFHIEGSEEYAGMDWASLNLVFEQDKNSTWILVAIVHDQWTI